MRVDSKQTDSIPIFLRESKVLLYFANKTYNSAVPDGFTEILKVTNSTGLCDGELAWYSQKANRWNCLYDLEHILGAYSFWPVWPCMLVDVLAIPMKFLEPCNFCIMFNCTFTFGLVWLVWVLWHIKHCRLFNPKISLYIYIKYIWLSLDRFYGTSIIVGYLMPKTLYTYISNVYDLV